MTRTPNTTADLETLLTIEQVARLEATSEKTIRRRIAAGDLRAMKYGRSFRIRPQDLRASRLQKLLGQ